MARYKQHIKRWSALLAVACTLVLIAVVLAVYQPAGGQGKAALQKATQSPGAPTTAAGPGQPASGDAATTAPATAASLPPTIEPTLAPTLTPTPLPSLGDMLAPRQPAEGTDSGGPSRYYTQTGHYLSGDFLGFYDSIPNSADLFGLPLTEEFPQQLPGGPILKVQYFERARFDYHPDSTPHVQLGNLAPDILKGRTFDRLAQPPSSDSSLYFPETGHSISGGFLDFWKANGALATFGYPLSEELSEDGLTVQYFERARMEYHIDLTGTPYGIQLSPVGYLAIKADLPSAAALPDGTLIAFNPPRVPEGHTAEITVNAAPGVTVTGSYEGRPLFFTYDPARGVAWSLIGAVAFEDLGVHEVTINIPNSSGETRTITRDLQVVPYRFPSESLQFDAQTALLLASDVVAKEQATLTEIFSGRTAHQYWSGPFRMPLDGPLYVTSYFGARRCYNCPDGSAPTSYHSGIDLGTEVGTPVHAAADGMVVFAGTLSDRGNTIIIDHGLGVYTLYAHNSRLIAHQGLFVQKGDVISLSGNTGLSNGPHLHWEMHVSGPPVDAPEWTRRTCLHFIVIGKKKY